MREDPDRASETLQHCLVEMEGESLRSPRRRRVSLLLSVTLQAVLLGGILMVPLLVNGEKLRATILIAPSPPYYGVPRGQQQQTPKGGSKGEKKKHPFDPHKFFQPFSIPTHPLKIDDAQSSSSSEDPGNLLPEGDPNSPLPPFDSLVPDARAPRPPLPQKAAPPPTPKRIRVTDLDSGRIVHRVEPVYPHLATQIHLQGTVRLRAVIGRDGTVHELELLSGHPLLAQAALAAVQQWRYQPTLLNGQPVEVETHITVVFILR